MYWERGSDKFTRIYPDPAGSPPPKKEEGGVGACLIQKPLEGDPLLLLSTGGASPHLARAGKRVVPTRTPRELQVTALEPRGGDPLPMLRSEGVAVPAPEKWEGGEGGSRFFKGGGTPLAALFSKNGVCRLKFTGSSGRNGGA
jgi:hypothetical protein